MNFKNLLENTHTLIHQDNVEGSVLKVKENDEYRWFEYGGEVVQSLMCKTTPQKLLTPVSQSLLLFLLWKPSPLKVLNLGLGGASIERYLASIPNVDITSVESSQAIINMAERHFELPKRVNVVCDKAEQFVYQHNDKGHIKYDVVVCDLFIEEKSPDFLFKDDFYSQVNAITTDKAVLMINLQAETNEQLLTALLAIKKQFAHIALIEFDDYKNIVIIASLVELPIKETLQEALTKLTHTEQVSLKKVLQKMRYIPAMK